MGKTKVELNPCSEVAFPGGWKASEMMVMMSGSRAGKSFWTNQAVDRLMRDLMNQPVDELVLSESRFAGLRFYTVEPIGGNWKEMEAWCNQVFGEASDIWNFKSSNEQFIWPENGRWIKNDRKFWFRNERDRTMFIMRWSSS